jgi:2',3'-cyclic-nucleotide 2'-phosphodiesterase (5'-nucleotidase family)
VAGHGGAEPELAKGSGDDDALGDWVADTMMAAASLGGPVQAALTNHGGLRRHLAPGPVRAEDLYEVLPFENQLVVAELTGAEMVQLVQETLRHPGGEPWATTISTTAWRACSRPWPRPASRS